MLASRRDIRKRRPPPKRIPDIDKYIRAILWRAELPSQGDFGGIHGGWDCADLDFLLRAGGGATEGIGPLTTSPGVVNSFPGKPRWYDRLSKPGPQDWL